MNQIQYPLQRRMVNDQFVGQVGALLIAIVLMVAFTVLACADMALTAYMFCLFFFFALVFIWIFCEWFGWSWRFLFGGGPLLSGGAICLMIVGHSWLGVILGALAFVVGALMTKMASNGTEMWFLSRRNWTVTALQVVSVIIAFFLFSAVFAGLRS